MAALDGGASSCIVQPFIQGREYSLNLLRVDSYSMCFPVVDKGPNSTEGVHPCGRPRFCPSSALARSTEDAMQAAAQLMADNAGMTGICEFEFLVTDDVTYLVEINPRVAATMRMASLAYGSSIFDRLVEVALGKVPTMLCRPSRKFTTEFPVPLKLAGTLPTGRLAPDVWVTTRVTIVADEEVELERRTRQIRGRLDDALRSSASPVDRSLFDT
jgi:biotin carboxylase